MAPSPSALFVRILYPALQLLAVLIRPFSILGGLALAAFLLFAVICPINGGSHRTQIVRAHGLLVGLFFSIATLAEIGLQIGYRSSPESIEIYDDTFTLIGLPLVDISKILRSVLADFAVAVAGFLVMRWSRSDALAVERSGLGSTLRKVGVLVCYIALLVAAFAWPCIIAAVYLLTISIVLVTWGIARGDVWSGRPFPTLYWRALHVFSVLIALTLYILQLIESVPETPVLEMIGFARFEVLSSATLPTLINADVAYGAFWMALLAVTMLIPAFVDADKDHGADRQSSYVVAHEDTRLLAHKEESSPQNVDAHLLPTAGRRAVSRGSVLTRLWIAHGTKVAILLLLFAAMELPSYIMLAGLVCALVAMLVPDRFLARAAPIFLLVLLTFVNAQYVYNWPSITPYSTTNCSTVDLGQCLSYTQCGICATSTLSYYNISVPVNSSDPNNNATEYEIITEGDYAAMCSPGGWHGPLEPCLGNWTHIYGAHDFSLYNSLEADIGIKAFAPYARGFLIGGQFVVAVAVAAVAFFRAQIIDPVKTNQSTSVSVPSYQDDNGDADVLLSEDGVVCCSPRLMQHRYFGPFFRVARFLLKHAYLLSLSALFFFGLTRVSMLNAVYMVFFIVYLIFPMFAEKSWIVLIIYAQLNIVLVYVWEFPFTAGADSNSASFWGLDNFHSEYLSLWEEEFWHLVILATALAQYSLFGFIRSLWAPPPKEEVDTDEDEEEERHRLISERRPVTTGAGCSVMFDLFVEWATDLFVHSGLAVAYIVLGAIIVLRHSVTFVTLGYALLLTIFLISHQVSPKAKALFVRRFWVVLVIYSGLIVIAEYFFLFPARRGWIDWLAAEIGVNVDAIGLTFFPESESQAALTTAAMTLVRFVALFSYTLALGVTVMQLRNFTSSDKGEGHHSKPIPRWFLSVENFICRFLILHSSKITLIVLFIAGVSSPSLINSFYIVSFAILVMLPKLNNFLMVPMLVIDLLIILLRLAYQIVFQFNSIQATNRWFEVYGSWAGLERFDGFIISNIYDSLIVGICLFLQRYAQRLQPHHADPVTQEVTLFPPIIHRNPGSRVDDPTPISIWTLILDSTAYYLSNAATVAGADLTIFTFIVACFVRLDAIGLVYLGVALCVIALPKNFTRKIWAMLPLFVVVMILWQYLLLFGTPQAARCAVGNTGNVISTQYGILAWPTCGDSGVCAPWGTCLCQNGYTSYNHSDPCSIPPPQGVPAIGSVAWWKHPVWDVTLLAWLDLLPAGWTRMLADLALVLVAQSQLRLSTKKRGERPRASTVDERPSFAEKKSKLEAIRMSATRHSFRVVLAGLFIAAAGQTSSTTGSTDAVTVDLSAFGYLVFALIYQRFGESLLAQRKRYWRYLRFYNLLILFLQALYQTPVISANSLPTLASLVGLAKLNGDGTNFAFTPAGVLMDFIIFVILTIQNHIFQSQYFETVMRYTDEQFQRAQDRAREIHARNVLEVQKAHQRIEREKDERLTRLNYLKQERENRSRVMTLLAEEEAIAESSDIMPRRSTLMRVRSGTKEDLSRREGYSTIDSPTVGQDQPMPDQPPTDNAGYAQTAPPTDAAPPSVQETILAPITVGPGNTDIVHRAVQGDAPVHGIGRPEEAPEAEVQPEDEAGPAPSEPSKLSKILATIVSVGHTIKTAVSSAIDNLAMRLMEDEYAADADDAESGTYAQRLDSTYAALVDDWHVLDEPRRPNRFFLLILALGRWMMRNTIWLCFLLFMLDGLAYANALSLVYPISVFSFGLLSYPRPNKAFWQSMMIYTEFVICLKFLINLPLFCLTLVNPTLPAGLTPPPPTSSTSPPTPPVFVGNPYISYAWCPMPECPPVDVDLKSFPAIITLSWPMLVGIYKAAGPTFLASIWVDFAVLLSLYVNRHVLRIRGVWDSDKFTEDNPVITAVEESAPLLVRGNTPNVDPDTSVKIPRTDERGTVNLNRSTSMMTTTTAPPDDGPSFFERRKAGAIELWTAIKQFYTSLTMSDKPGSDYYAFQFLVEIVAFFFIMFGWGSFFPSNSQVAVSGTANVLTFLSSNQIPVLFIFVLIGQFVLLIIDRTIYLWRSIHAKLIMQYVTVVGFHIVLFFVLPTYNGRPLTSSIALIVIYLFKLAYWTCSAMQIRDGYPYLTRGHFLTKKPTLTNQILFSVYRGLPFVFELRTLLDWINTDTALSFFAWLQIEDIYANLFSLQCDEEYLRQNPRKIGDRQTKTQKCTSGVLIFALLSILLWLPPLLFSSATPIMQPNPVASANFELYIAGYADFYQLNVPNIKYIFNAMTQETYQAMCKAYPAAGVPITHYNNGDVQMMVLNRGSQTTWDIAPAARSGLQQLLARALLPAAQGGCPTYNVTNSNCVIMTVQFTFTRNITQVAQQVSGSRQVWLAPEQVATFANTLNNTNPEINFPVAQLLPRFIHLPIDGAPQVAGPYYMDANMTLRRTPLSPEYAIESWSFTVEPVLPYFVDPNDGGTNRPIMILVSDLIPSGVFSALASSGIIGLYITVVLAAARFLRAYVSALAQRIPLDELRPDCSAILQMVQDIYVARQGDGPDLILEEELYNELIQLYRSPEALIEKTKPKQKLE